MPAKTKKTKAAKQISPDDFMLEFNRLVAKHLSKTRQDQQLHPANEVLNNFTESNSASREKRSALKKSRKRVS